MTASSTSTDELLKRRWDVVVVGTGMGGATLGHRLASAGLQVLFCERGSVPTLRGGYPEMAGGNAVPHDGGHRLLPSAGRDVDALIDVSTSRARRFAPFIGSGPGGSSALYGMALERFMPADFEAGDWPIGYAELAPYYAAAEALYRVRGEVDPIAAARIGAAPAPQLLAPPPLSPAAAELAGFLRSRGLHPYRLPSACEYADGCTSCQSYLCARDCKNDAERICLRPALTTYGAALLADCRATALRTDGRRVTGVHARWRGREVELRARVVVLAAGALHSPLILLRSQGQRPHPGLGNRSGLVGRRLMRHLIDLYLVRPAERDAPFDNRHKELACNDFYGEGQDKLGTLQSFGRLPPAPMLFDALHSDASASRWGGAAAPVVRLARPLLLPFLRDLSEGWMTLASIVEDLPDPANGVAPHGRDLALASLRYCATSASLQRAQRLGRQLARVLRGRSWRRLAQATNNQRIAHVCGTCRFGDDPRTSVLDRDNRVHDLDNLFVIDSSFFPTSGGTNPALTVAANALRVGERLAVGLP